MKAIEDIHRHTCLRFVPYNGHRNYIEFDNRDGYVKALKTTTRFSILHVSEWFLMLLISL